MDMLWELHNKLARKLENGNKNRLSLDKRKKEPISPTRIQADYPKVLAMYELTEERQEPEVERKYSIQGIELHNLFGMFGAMRKGLYSSNIQKAYPTQKTRALEAMAEATMGLSTEMRDDPIEIYNRYSKASKRFYQSDKLLSLETMPLSERFTELGVSDPVDWAKAVYEDPSFPKKVRDLAYALASTTVSSDLLLFADSDIHSLFETSMSVSSPYINLKARFDAVSLGERIEVTNLKSSPHRLEPEIELRQTQTELYIAEQLVTEYWDVFTKGELKDGKPYLRGKVPHVHRFNLSAPQSNSVYHYLLLDRSGTPELKRVSYSFKDALDKNFDRGAEFLNWLSWYSSSLYLMRAKSQLEVINRSYSLAKAI